MQTDNFVTLDTQEIDTLIFEIPDGLKSQAEKLKSEYVGINHQICDLYKQIGENFYLRYQGCGIDAKNLSELCYKIDTLNNDKEKIHEKIQLLIPYPTELEPPENEFDHEKSCPDCDLKFSAEAPFCSNCGTELISEKKSKNCECGYENSPEAAFCVNCGTSLT